MKLKPIGAEAIKKAKENSKGALFCGYCGDKFEPVKNKERIIAYFGRKEKDSDRQATTMEFICDKCGAMTTVQGMVNSTEHFKKYKEILDLYKHN